MAGGIIEATMGQKWIVTEGFNVKRPTGRFEVPKGGILTVKTKPNGADDLWVDFQGHKFQISQANMKSKAVPT